MASRVATVSDPQWPDPQCPGPQWPDPQWLDPQWHWRDPTGDLRQISEPILAESGVYAPVLCLVDYGVAVEQSSCVTSFQGARLQHIDIFRYEGQGLHRGRREHPHINADKLSDYLITIPLQAHIEFTQEGRCAELNPGAFALLSTAKPFIGSVGHYGEGDSFSSLHIRVSGPALRYRLPYVDECCGRPVRLQAGAGTIMRAMCELAIKERHALTSAQAAQFGTMLIDAVAAALDEAPEILSLPMHNSSTSHVRIWRQAKAYIELNLANPDLDTAMIAHHCRVSKRYLQGTFASFGETVTATIREMRLQRCQADLRKPMLRNRSVSEIALHWGFNDLPYFCRTYKVRFGRSPSRDRAEP